jgi:hypothetical protein
MILIDTFSGEKLLVSVGISEVTDAPVTKWVNF